MELASGCEIANLVACDSIIFQHFGANSVDGVLRIRADWTGWFGFTSAVVVNFPTKRPGISSHYTHINKASDQRISTHEVNDLVRARPSHQTTVAAFTAPLD